MSILTIILSTHRKADWDGLRDRLRDVPRLDIFKHDAIYAAEEIAEWVEIDIDCYIPHFLQERSLKVVLDGQSSPPYHQCWTSSGIGFGVNLIPGFY